MGVIRIRNNGWIPRKYWKKILHILKKHELTKYHWAFFPGLFWNLMRVSFILYGCRKLLIGYMKMIFL